MTVVRLLPNGARRRLPDGSVRALGANGPRYTDIGGATGVGVGAGGLSTAWVPLAGEGVLSFTLAADLDSAGVLGRTTLAVAVAGQLSATVNVVAATALGFATAGRLTGLAPVAGATAVTVQIAGALTGAASLAGGTVARIRVQAVIGSPTGIRGVAGLGFGVTGTLSTAAGGRWRDLWREVYDKRQALLNAIDANNRNLARDAGDAAQAAANAVVVTNTRVDAVDGRITAEANRITALTTRVTNTENTNVAQGSAISALQTTTTLHGNTLTSHSSQLTGLSASVTTLDGRVTNVANATELLEVEVDSLGAAKAIKGLYLNVNGYISGYQSINDGTVAEFSIMADVFRLLSPGSVEGMEWRDGYLRIYGSGYQRILGYNFGAAGQNLVDWFGPNVGAAGASKSNATMWMDKSGNAYWGGSLSAGILKNAAQSTQLGVGANVSTGTFGSMGNTRTVVCSFSLHHTGDRVGNNAGMSIVGVTVNLYRNGSLVQSSPISGNYTGVYDAELNRTRYTCNFGGSFTHTDNTGGTSCEYSLTLSSKVGTWPRTDFNNTTGGPTQRLSVISTEEP